MVLEGSFERQSCVLKAPSVYMTETDARKVVFIPRKEVCRFTLPGEYDLDYLRRISEDEENEEDFDRALDCMLASNILDAIESAIARGGSYVKIVSQEEYARLRVGDTLDDEDEDD